MKTLEEILAEHPNHTPHMAVCIACSEKWMALVFIGGTLTKLACPKCGEHFSMALPVDPEPFMLVTSKS